MAISSWKNKFNCDNCLFPYQQVAQHTQIMPCKLIREILPHELNVMVLIIWKNIAHKFNDRKQFNRHQMIKKLIQGGEIICWNFVDIKAPCKKKKKNKETDESQYVYQSAIEFTFYLKSTNESNQCMRTCLMALFGKADIISMFRYIFSFNSCCATSIRLNGSGADGDKPVCVQNLGRTLYACTFACKSNIKFAL